MAEELALEKGVDHCGAVADREALLADRTDLVNRASDELFAGTGGANQQDVGIVARNFAREIENFEHGGTFADDAVKFEILEELFLEGANAATLVVEGGDFVEGALEANVIDGLGKKIGGAAANSFESGVESVTRSHDQDVQARIATQGAIKEVVGVGRVEMDAGEDEATTAEANEAKSFLSITSGNGFIPHIGDYGIESVTLRGVVVKNARS